MCGINIRSGNRFLIKPLVGGHFTFADATYKSVYGVVRSGWKRESGKTVFEISVPSNCTAEIILPNGTAEAVAAGNHKFEIQEA